MHTDKLLDKASVTMAVTTYLTSHLYVLLQYWVFCAFRDAILHALFVTSAYIPGIISKNNLLTCESMPFS